MVHRPQFVSRGRSFRRVTSPITARERRDHPIIDATAPASLLCSTLTVVPRSSLFVQTKTAMTRKTVVDTMSNISSVPNEDQRKVHSRTPSCLKRQAVRANKHAGTELFHNKLRS